MPNYSLQKIEIQLKKRLQYPYIWGRKQEDSWDKKTNFIYKILDFDELLKHLEKSNNKNETSQDLFNYTLNRWFNFWSAQGIEQVFQQLPEVIQEENHRHKFIDFYIKNIPFDHKTSVFPKTFPLSARKAYAKPEKLINWLYQNQSQEQRKHFENRLFIILYDKESEQHWKLKAELFWLKTLIENYIHNFSKEKLYKIEINESKTVLADIIWAIR